MKIGSIIHHKFLVKRKFRDSWVTQASNFCGTYRYYIHLESLCLKFQLALILCWRGMWDNMNYTLFNAEVYCTVISDAPATYEPDLSEETFSQTTSHKSVMTSEFWNNYSHCQNCWETLHRDVYIWPPLPLYNIESSIFIHSLLVDPNIAWCGRGKYNGMLEDSVDFLVKERAISTLYNLR